MSKSLSETKLTVKFCEEIKRYNGFVVPMVAGKMQTPGLPDRYVCHATFGGLWIEFKKDRTTVTPMQHIMIWKMLDRCVPVVVIRFGSAGEITAEIPHRESSAVRDAWPLCSIEEDEIKVSFVRRAKEALLESALIKIPRGATLCRD